MARYGVRSGLERFIPAGGEGRALVEVRGRYGNMKGARTKGSRFRALRKGRFTKKPQTWLPLAPGPQNVSNRPEVTVNYFSNPGSTEEQSPDMGWLFAITPERDLVNVTSVMAIGGDIDEDQKYRVVGIKGNLFYTPLASLNEDVGTVEACTGFVETYWYKVKTSLDSAANLSNSPLTFPWSGGWDDTANTSGIHVQGFVPWQQSIAVSSGPSALRNRDPRWRSDVMFHSKTPWVLPHFPYFDQTTMGVQYRAVAPCPVRIPLPCRVICNVGAGEALACAYVITSQSGVNVESSPAGIFSFNDMKIMVHELD